MEKKTVKEVLEEIGDFRDVRILDGANLMCGTAGYFLGGAWSSIHDKKVDSYNLDRGTIVVDF